MIPPCLTTDGRNSTLLTVVVSFFLAMAVVPVYLHPVHCPYETMGAHSTILSCHDVELRARWSSSQESRDTYLLSIDAEVPEVTLNFLFRYACPVLQLAE